MERGYHNKGIFEIRVDDLKRLAATW